MGHPVVIPKRKRSVPTDQPVGSKKLILKRKGNWCTWFFNHVTVYHSLVFHLVYYNVLDAQKFADLE